MANQPKKYKKFVATAATATLVASAIVPVASAKSFSDVAENNEFQPFIDALSNDGIINGYTDGTFKPGAKLTRGQVVKMLGRWIEANGAEVPSDWETVQRFNDVPVNNADKELVKYAALVKDEGVFTGSNGNLSAANNITRQQMAKVLNGAYTAVNGVSLVDIAGSIDNKLVTDLASAQQEFEGYIQALVDLEISTVSVFRPSENVTRAQFAKFLYNTINLEAVTAAGVKAINNTTVEVTFGEEISDIKALDFAIEGLEVKNAVVKQTDKTTAVLTTAAQEGGKEYTVSVNDEEVGSFTGITAVVPTKVELVSNSVQGKLGQQVTVQAKVTVAEGQSKAGIPVTFSVPGNANDAVKPTVTGEAYTNEEGIATYTYTRYAATTDTVTTYATGDRSKFSLGYVFWGVDTILSVEEVTEGATINNGANKTYKVTYKNPTTGKPEANVRLNVSALENINVTADKVKNATVNGVNVQQLSNGSVVKAAQITTDSKGEATFTVSGTNTEVTPVVYEGAKVYDTNGSLTGHSQKYEASSLQTTASKVKFAAVQAEYTIELTRDGGEVAAIGSQNGRKYNVVVKDKDGKLAANEVVNVAFNEDIDRVIGTVTEAEFIELNNDGDKIGYRSEEKITVKTNSKGEASFYIGNGKENTYATPVAWIDINSANAREGQLDEGEPTTVGAISYFQNQYVDGAAIKVADTDGKKKSEFNGEGPAVFKVNLTNQSGEEYILGGQEEIKSVSYTVFNTGANEVYVYDGTRKQFISPNRSYTLTNFGTGDLKVYSEEGKTTSVKVVATGVAKYFDQDLRTYKDFNFNAKEATAKFTATNEIANPYTGVIDLASINTDKKEISFVGKKAIKYAGETGKTYKYYGIGSTPIATAANFIEELEGYAGQTVRVTYKVEDDVVSFYIISVGAGTGAITSPVDAAAKLNSATTLAQVEDAIKGLAEYVALSTEAKTAAKAAILADLQAGGTYTAAKLTAALQEGAYFVNVTAAYTAGTPAVSTATAATGVYANATTPANTLTIASAAGATAYNDFKVVFEANTVTGTAVTTDYDAANKTLTVKLPVTIDAVTGVATIDTTNATFAAVETAIEAFNNSALTVTLATLSGDASELVGETITLDGAEATATAVAGKLTLTFSEAITGVTAVTLNDAAATSVTLGTPAVSADGKTVVITLSSADEAILAATGTTEITTLTVTPTLGKTIILPVTITK